jgi:hypothetical protein
MESPDRKLPNRAEIEFDFVLFGKLTCSMRFSLEQPCTVIVVALGNCEYSRPLAKEVVKI